MWGETFFSKNTFYEARMRKLFWGVYFLVWNTWSVQVMHSALFFDLGVHLH